MSRQTQRDGRTRPTEEDRAADAFSTVVERKGDSPSRHEPSGVSVGVRRPP